MKGLIILANHFEDIEALGTIDLLRRAKITIDLVSVVDSRELTTQSGLKIEAEYLYQDIDLNDYDFLVIPGGKATFENNLSSLIVKNIVKHFNDKKQLIACICAAPMILGKYGYLNNLPYTCFPTCESEDFNGIYQQDKKVVVVNNYITSKAAGTTFEFSYEIIKYLLGETKAIEVLKNVYYL